MLRVLLIAVLVLRDMILELHAEQLTGERAVVLARETDDAQMFSLSTMRAKRRWPRFWKTEPRGGMMTSRELNDAVTDASGAPDGIWEILPDDKPRLQRTLRHLARELPDGFAVQVLWIGDEHQREESITLDAMLALVAGDGLESYTRYQVRP